MKREAIVIIFILILCFAFGAIVALSRPARKPPIDMLDRESNLVIPSVQYEEYEGKG